MFIVGFLPPVIMDDTRSLPFTHGAIILVSDSENCESDLEF